MNMLADPAGPELETKYVLPNHAAELVIRWLRTHCRPDPRHTAGVISSIYYDTPDWTSLFETRNGDYLKTKVRLRYYAEIGTGQVTGQAFLEAKLRIGAGRNKLRLETDLPAARVATWRLDDRRLRRIPELLGGQGFLIPAEFAPAFTVTYERFRFVEPHTQIRLCVDRNIHVSAVNPQMLPRWNRQTLPTAVMETKGRRRELPASLERLIDLGLRRQSFSKYGSCYQMIMRTAW